MIYQFSKTIRPDKLQQEIIDFGLTDIIHIDTVETDVFIHFGIELSSEQQDQLNALVTAHTPSITSEAVDLIISNACNFGNSLSQKFASENVMMGITASGKTIAVSDYLHKLSHYLTTGSLYAAIDKIDSMILEEVPVELSPFVTEARLLTYKGYLETYLGL